MVLPAAGVLTLALAASGCGGSSTPGASGNTPVKGGIAVMAEPPSSPANYIYPFMDSATYLMYRPLYWFGEVGQPVVNTSLSLAAVPVISGRTVTITLKHYMWSN